MRSTVSGQLSRSKDKRDPETYAIIGVAMEIHRELGPGFLEAVYQDALEWEFKIRNIPFVREHPIPVIYKGTKLGTPYRVDFFVSVPSLWNSKPSRHCLPLKMLRPSIISKPPDFIGQC